MGSRTSPNSEQSNNVEKLIGWTKIKKESPDNEIKEFAETAMNELLGWYGYDKMARDDSSLLQGLPPSSSAASSTRMSSRSRKHSSEPLTSDPDSSDDEVLPLNRRNRLNDKTQSTDKLNKKTTDASICGWCNKQLPNDVGQASGSFCSELCFSQSRRASFKKNKTCDWCRHVRHTVSYVDFQDGASQLQFCSDKCLNQYKMHIFCREAQAHLELLPHVHVPNSDSAVQQGLITPDLWLRNCRSPSNEILSPSPVYSSPPPTTNPPTQTTTTTTPSTETPIKPPQQTSPLPLITVAHPSKLMSYPEKIEDLRVERNKSSKSLKRRRNSNCCSSATVTSSIKDSPTSSHNNNNHPQDLSVQTNSPIRTKPVPDAIPIMHANLNGATIPENIPPPNNQTTGPGPKHFVPPPNFFAYPRPPHLFPEPPRLFHPNMFPPTMPQSFIPPAPPPRPPFSSILPPVTVLVPYPVILPIPLPIPIPIPLGDFLKAASSSLKKENLTNNNTATSTPANENNNNNNVDEKINLDTSEEAETDTTESQNNEKEQIDVETNENSPVSDTASTLSMRPLRKRKRLLTTKDTTKEINCKTRKIKYLSV